METISVTVPDGAVPGSVIPIQLHDGSTTNVQVPAGVGPGQQFQVAIAAAAPTSTTQVPIQVVSGERVNVHPVRRAVGEGPKHAQGNACCFIFFAVVTLILSLWLLTSVWNYFGTPFRYAYYCYCGFGYWGYCCYTTIGNTMSTQPISQDMLPFSNDTITEQTQGDGIPDYWSLVVMCCCGTVGSLFIICSALTPSLRRGGRATSISCGIVTAFLILLAGIICVSVQMFDQKDQWVYNAFIPQQFEYIQGQSLISYLTNNRYYSYYGGLVWWQFIFTIILTFYALIYTLLMCFGSEDISGARFSRGDDGSFYY